MVVSILATIIMVISGSIIFASFMAAILSVLSGSFLFRGSADKEQPSIIFQITTKNCGTTVQRGISSILEAAATVHFDLFEIWVVTDNPKPNLKMHRKVQVVSVPADFTCKARFKGRALEYAARVRKEEDYDGWIYFMDEENWISSQTIAAITHFIKHSKAKLATGPMLLKKGESMFAWLADSMRTYQNRITHLGHLLGWWAFQGENLLMHATIEQRVGWDRDSLVEDMHFSAVANSLGMKAGWHGAELYSTSPSCFSDLLVQRRRWFGGMAEFIATTDMMAHQRYTILYCLLCTLSGLLLFPSAIFVLRKFFILPKSIEFFTILALSTYCMAYYWGCTGKIVHKIATVLLCPLFGVIESLAAWWSVIDPPQDFDIIRKV